MPISIVDSKSALELAQTKDIIDNFWVDLCGLTKIKMDGSDAFIRVSKPKMTYEFAKDVTSNIYIEINRLTARTTFSVEQIDAYLSKQSETMCNWFASEGMGNLVSPRVWEICLQLSEPDKSANTVNINDKEVLPNFWWTRYSIYWDYNQPFNIEMMNIIKRNYNLQAESFGQATILRTLFWSIRIFIHGGLNRSKEHLTLDHEKVIHKENTVFSGTSDSTTSEGMFERFKHKIQNSVRGKPKDEH